MTVRELYLVELLRKARRALELEYGKGCCKEIDAAIGVDGQVSPSQEGVVANRSVNA